MSETIKPDEPSESNESYESSEPGYNFVAPFTRHKISNVRVKVAWTNKQLRMTWLSERLQCSKLSQMSQPSRYMPNLPGGVHSVRLVAVNPIGYPLFTL